MKIFNAAQAQPPIIIYDLFILFIIYTNKNNKSVLFRVQINQ